MFRDLTQNGIMHPFIYSLIYSFICQMLFKFYGVSMTVLEPLVKELNQIGRLEKMIQRDEDVVLEKSGIPDFGND